MYCDIIFFFRFSDKKKMKMKSICIKEIFFKSVNMKIFILFILNGNKEIEFLKSPVLFLTCQNIGRII